MDNRHFFALVATGVFESVADDALGTEAGDDGDRFSGRATRPDEVFDASVDVFGVSRTVTMSTSL